MHLNFIDYIRYLRIILVREFMPQLNSESAQLMESTRSIQFDPIGRCIDGNDGMARPSVTVAGGDENRFVGDEEG